MHDWLKKLDPAIPKYWLISLAGISWSLIGLMLCGLAVHWLLNSYSSLRVYLFVLGVFLALLMNYFMFSRIAQKNINRLDLVTDKSCLFAFQAWKSYLIIILMIFMGYFIRHSAFPKHYLASIYLAIGGALFFASLQYYRYLWRVMGSDKI